MMGETTLLRGIQEDLFTKLHVYFYKLAKHNPKTMKCSHTNVDNRFYVPFDHT